MHFNMTPAAFSTPWFRKSQKFAGFLVLVLILDPAAMAKVALFQIKNYASRRVDFDSQLVPRVRPVNE